MAFPLTKNDAESYFKALNFMKSAGLCEDEDNVNPPKKFYTLAINSIDIMVVPQTKDPVKIDYPLCIKTRELLMTLLKKVMQMIVDENDQQNKVTESTKKSNKKNVKGDYKQKLQRLEAVIHLQLGKMLSQTEDLKGGEKELSKSWLILENDDKDYIISRVKQDVLNECGLLSLKQGNSVKSVKYYEEAKKLYENLKDRFSPWCVDDFFRAEAYKPQFNDDKKRTYVFERNFNRTLYNLAIMYQNMGRKSEAVSCIRQFLSTQLDNQRYTILIWVYAAANLSEFYVSINDFKMARHCLAAAETVLKQKGDCPSNLFVMVPKGLSKEEIDAKEKVPRIWAELYRFWVNYCLSLLNFSFQPSLNRPTVSERDEFSFLLDVTECESQVRAEKVVSFEDARQVFLKGQAWLNRSKEFFHLQGYCTEYVGRVMKNNTLFDLLASFEPDIDRKCKMQKRRIDMMTELFNQLNQELYPSLCYNACFMIGDSYYKLALLKVNKISNAFPNTNAANKIGSIANKSIKYLEMFLNFLRNPQGRLPETFEKVDELKVINAHMYIASCYSMISNYDKVEERCFNYAKTIKIYSYIVQYCHNAPSDIPWLRSKMLDSVKHIYGLSAAMLKMKAHP